MLQRTPHAADTRHQLAFWNRAIILSLITAFFELLVLLLTLL
jgi:hypothetical protein